MRRTIVGMYLMASADAYMLGVGSAVQPCRDRAFSSIRGMAHAPARLRSSGDKTQLKMGIFDLFKNALANEDLPPPPPDGLSSDPWLSGMKKTISVSFIKDGKVVAVAEALPGDKIKDIAMKAKVQLPETCMMKANEQEMAIAPATSRVPAPQRRNLLDLDEGGGEMMDSGLSAPVWTNLSQRGEVRTVTVKKTEYQVYL